MVVLVVLVVELVVITQKLVEQEQQVKVMQVVIL